MTETRKYELLSDETTQSWDGRTLYRIRALVNIQRCCAGGGIVNAPLPGDDDTPARLDDDGDCWWDRGPTPPREDEAFPWACWIALGVVGVAVLLTVGVLIARGA